MARSPRHSRLKSLPPARRRLQATLLAGALAAAAPAGAGIVLVDDFDSELGSGGGASGQSGENYGGFAQWQVTAGTVDLIAHGDFAPGAGILCMGGGGKCVDLDGSTGSAGTLTSRAIALDAGDYLLSYALAGVDAGFSVEASNAPNQVEVLVRDLVRDIDLFSASATLYKGDPFARFEGGFALAAPTSAAIVFRHAGGDNFGAVLDEVSLRSVPLPPTAALLAGGVWVAAQRRRRTARPPKQARGRSPADGAAG